MDMTAKYISASLLTVSRMLGPFILLYIDFMIWVCTMTRTKTAMSMEPNWCQYMEGREGG